MNATLVLGALTVYLIGLTVVLALLHAEGGRVAEERPSGVDGGGPATDGGSTMDGEWVESCGGARDGKT